MKNKGFTLVELLAVVVLLAIITLIAVPIITNMIKDSEIKSYERQVQTIEEAAERWSTKASLPTEADAYIYVEVSELKENGYLKDEQIINPKNNQEMTGRVKITYDIEYNQYKYEYQEI